MTKYFLNNSYLYFSLGTFYGQKSIIPGTLGTLIIASVTNLHENRIEAKESIVVTIVVTRIGVTKMHENHIVAKVRNHIIFIFSHFSMTQDNPNEFIFFG